MKLKITRFYLYIFQCLLVSDNIMKFVCLICEWPFEANENSVVFFFNFSTAIPSRSFKKMNKHKTESAFNLANRVECIFALILFHKNLNVSFLESVIKKVKT